MNDDDSELAMIRRKKMLQLMEREKRLHEQQERERKVRAERERLLHRFLAPEAESYLSQLKQREPTIARRIEDVLLYLIVYRGFRQPFSQLDVRYVERQIKGEGPRIRVQRDGEVSDFGAYVREAMKRDSDE